MGPGASPVHLVVLVNGLWGWQRDWARTKAQLEAMNDGSHLIHVSSVNVGPQTYAGIDVCGQRLAAEVQQVVAKHPSLTTISFIGHSMGGLIARYTIGLLAKPSTRTVAGLHPAHYISIASPHLGCSSSHPGEVHWQDRPWMRWLAAAVSAGHLGGHEHLATTTTSSSSSSRSSTSTNSSTKSSGSQAGSTRDAASSGTARQESDMAQQQHKQAQEYHQLEQQQEQQGKVDAGTSTTTASTNLSTTVSASSSRGGHSSVAAGSSQDKQQGAVGSKNAAGASKSRSWPWTPCRSVVQLLGCDAWHGPPPQTTTNSSSSSSSTSTSTSSYCDCTASQVGTCPVCGSSSSSSSSSNGGTDSSHGDNKVNGCSGCHESRMDKSGLLQSNGSGGSSGSAGDETAKHQGWLVRSLMHPASDSCNGAVSSSTSSNNASTGGGDGSSGSSSCQPSSLLDFLAADVELCRCCSSRQQLYFLSGLALFENRATYSSAGGDHLIPWSSSSLLPPQDLPVRGRAPRDAAAAAAAATAAGTAESTVTGTAAGTGGGTVAGTAPEVMRLPASGLFTVKPVIVEQQQQQQQQQQHQQQQQQHQQHEKLPKDGHVHEQEEQASRQQQQQPGQQQQDSTVVTSTTQASSSGRATLGHTASNGTGSNTTSTSISSSSSNSSRSSSIGGLGARLARLQALPWCRFHVVWPRLCIGSSHCNIQYNGPLNFAGQAVVEHVAALVLGRRQKPDSVR